MIASPLNAQEALRAAIHQVIQPHNLEGMTRVCMLTVQAAPKLEITLEDCSERASTTLILKCVITKSGLLSF